MNNINSFVSGEELLLQERYKNDIRKKIQGRGYKAFVFTLGCQQNEADSERIRGMLKEVGYTITEKEEEDPETAENDLL